MKYQIEDEYGDKVVVTPVPSRGVIPAINVTFVETETGEIMEMMLTDRQWADLKQAGNRSMKESERIG